MEKTITIDLCKKCDDEGHVSCQCGIICADFTHKCYDYGDDEPTVLWECPGCERWLCYANGMADENSELCDSCAAKTHPPNKALHPNCYAALD